MKKYKYMHEARNATLIRLIINTVLTNIINFPDKI